MNDGARSEAFIAALAEELPARRSVGTTVALAVAAVAVGEAGPAFRERLEWAAALEPP
jgi:hypothetical protein